MVRKEEAKLQDKIVRKLKADNILYLKTTGGMVWLPDGKNGFRMFKQKKGFSDLIAFMPSGEVWFLEIKSEKGKLSEDQKVMKRRLENLTHNYLVIRPSYWENVKSQFKEAGGIFKQTFWDLLSVEVNWKDESLWKNE